jgi:ubiquinone/menaquinone biosynthesis C-methylase UbiE
MKFKNKKNYYWDEVYSKVENIKKPSSFAKFCIKKFIDRKKNKKLLDIGCGDGRDTLFFSKKLDSTGIDKSKAAINFLKLKYFNYQNCKFYRFNLDYLNNANLLKYDYIYLRFLIHAINLSSEKKLFIYLKKKLIKKNSLIMAEFRSDKDPLMKLGKKISKYERYTDHYRRFINFENFKCKLKKLGFKIIYNIERRGLSIAGNDNPILCRFIFKKK